MLAMVVRYLHGRTTVLPFVLERPFIWRLSPLSSSFSLVCRFGVVLVTMLSVSGWHMVVFLLLWFYGFGSDLKILELRLLPPRRKEIRGFFVYVLPLRIIVFSKEARHCFWRRTGLCMLSFSAMISLVAVVFVLFSFIFCFVSGSWGWVRFRSGLCDSVWKYFIWFLLDLGSGF